MLKSSLKVFDRWRWRLVPQARSGKSKRSFTELGHSCRRNEDWLSADRSADRCRLVLPDWQYSRCSGEVPTVETLLNQYGDLECNALHVVQEGSQVGGCARLLWRCRTVIRRKFIFPLHPLVPSECDQSGRPGWKATYPRRSFPYQAFPHRSFPYRAFPHRAFLHQAFPYHAQGKSYTDLNEYSTNYSTIPGISVSPQRERSGRGGSLSHSSKVFFLRCFHWSLVDPPRYPTRPPEYVSFLYSHFSPLLASIQRNAAETVGTETHRVATPRCGNVRCGSAAKPANIHYYHFRDDLSSMRLLSQRSCSLTIPQNVDWPGSVTAADRLPTCT